MSTPTCSTCAHYHWSTHLTDPVGFCKAAAVGWANAPLVTCFTARHRTRPSWLRRQFGATDWCGPEGHYWRPRTVGPSPAANPGASRG